MTSARDLSLLYKQFKYMYLKGLAMYFQKMVLFTMLWLTVSVVLGYEIQELC